MDLIVVGACALGIIVIWAWAARPGGPDPENPDDAPQALGEGMAGLFGVLLLAVLAVAAVLLF